MSRNRLIPLLAVAALVLLALPAAASDSVIRNGIDVWHTTSGTFANFRSQPIPAGFLCAGSSAFAGRVPLRGVPIVTRNPGDLGGADTVVQRLDDASFDRTGIARTRIQFKAMHLASSAPIKTACGSFNVQVTLDGLQPTTIMRIVQDKREGGHFVAPLALNVKMSFTPVGRKSNERLELVRPIRFPAAQNALWAFETNAKAARIAPFTQIDTDGDGVPDTYVPGTSNFATGRRIPDKQLYTEREPTFDPVFHENDCATHIVN